MASVGRGIAHHTMRTALGLCASGRAVPSFAQMWARILPATFSGEKGRRYEDGGEDDGQVEEEDAQKAESSQEMKK